MAKGFHYFKFIATEWLTGDIVFEDFELQGIFINICALYWHRDGKLSIDEIKKRLKTERLTNLTDRFISVTDGFISIKFLDEQLIEAGHISKTNSVNGKKGGRPKAASNLQNKATAKRPLTDRKANESQIELEVELKESKLNKNTHDDFGKKLLDNDLEKESIEISSRENLTPLLISRFNTHLINESKKHNHYSEWKKHLVRWIPKRPKEEIEKGKSKDMLRVEKILQTNKELKDDITREYGNN